MRLAERIINGRGGRAVTLSFAHLYMSIVPKKLGIAVIHILNYFLVHFLSKYLCKLC